MLWFCLMIKKYARVFDKLRIIGLTRPHYLLKFSHGLEFFVRDLVAAEPARHRGQECCTVRLDILERRWNSHSLIFFFFKCK